MCGVLVGGWVGGWVGGYVVGVRPRDNTIVVKLRLLVRGVVCLLSSTTMNVSRKSTTVPHQNDFQLHLLALESQRPPVRHGGGII